MGLVSMQAARVVDEGLIKLPTSVANMAELKLLFI